MDIGGPVRKLFQHPGEDGTTAVVTETGRGDWI